MASSDYDYVGGRGTTFIMAPPNVEIGVDGAPAAIIPFVDLVGFVNHWQNPPSTDQEIVAP